MAGDNERADGQKATRHRSPNYPGISLKAAVEKIASWYKADNVVASSKEAAMRHMNGDAGRVISALKSFGLIIELPDDGRIKLAQRGIDIVARGHEDPKRKTALKEAGLSPTIYRELVKEYGANLPSDSTLASELIASRSFNPKVVDNFIKDFRATLSFAGISALPVVESVSNDDGDGVGVREGDYVQWESQGIAQFSDSRRVNRLSEDGSYAFVEGSNTGIPVGELTIENPNSEISASKSPSPQLQMQRPKNWAEAQQQAGTPQGPSTRQDVFSLREGTVTIQWPESLSADSFQDLSDWLDLVKRKIGRSVTKVEGP